MADIKLRKRRAIEECELVKFRQGVRDILVLPVDLANPVHRLSPRPDIFDEFGIASQFEPVNDTAMIIRDAVSEDASGACQVIRRSITELCAVDYKNDPVVLQRWLNNKAPEVFRKWIKSENSLLLAVEGGNILAVGCVTDAGKIMLNYVSPDARFRGVSSALLSALERRAQQRGNERCTLESTETARQFYLARGYTENGPPGSKFGTAGGYPMTKLIGAT
jgi:GNAT superfamily N-acetyltransferase